VDLGSDLVFCLPFGDQALLRAHTKKWDLSVTAIALELGHLRQLFECLSGEGTRQDLTPIVLDRLGGEGKKQDLTPIVALTPIVTPFAPSRRLSARRAVSRRVTRTARQSIALEYHGLPMSMCSEDGGAA